MTTKPEMEVGDIPDPVRPRELWPYKAWGYLVTLLGTWVTLYWLVAPEYFPNGFFTLQDNWLTSMRGYILVLVFAAATGVVYLAIMSDVEDRDKVAQENYRQEIAQLDRIRRRKLYPVGAPFEGDGFMSAQTAPVVASNPSRHATH